MLTLMPGPAGLEPDEADLQVSYVMPQTNALLRLQIGELEPVSQVQADTGSLIQGVDAVDPTAKTSISGDGQTVVNEGAQSVGIYLITFTPDWRNDSTPGP